MAIVIRVAVIAVLLVGPWTDDPAELSGWDAERFQEIADRDASAWVEQPIEYPPGSVLVFDVIAGDDVVSTNRSIIILSALAELAGTVLLWRTAGPRSAKAFIFLGLALVPMGYLRLDMMVTVIAAAAAIALVFLGAGQPSGRRSVDTIVFPVLAVIGAMIKIWPALLVMGALGIGRKQQAIATALLGGAAGVAWLGIVGAGIEPLDQVLSLRGAQGWHVESLPGALIALGGDQQPRLELNAFRIGTMNSVAVTIGRVLAVAMTVALAVTAARRSSGEQSDSLANSLTDSLANSPYATTRRLGLVMLGSVSALIITAPLLSPQFLLWLTPWGAMTFAHRPSIRRIAGLEPPLVLLVAAIVLTGFTLTVFGPQNLAETVPALLLTTRNVALLALPVTCLLALRSELRER